MRARAWLDGANAPPCATPFHARSGAGVGMGVALLWAGAPPRVKGEFSHDEYEDSAEYEDEATSAAHEYKSYGARRDAALTRHVSAQPTVERARQRVATQYYTLQRSTPRCNAARHVATRRTLSRRTRGSGASGEFGRAVALSQQRRSTAAVRLRCFARPGRGPEGRRSVWPTAAPCSFA